MKNISLALNVVLLAAVIFLYVKVFSGAKKTDTSNTAMTVTSQPHSFDPAPIAYIDLDSLNEKINYIKTRREQLEAEQKSIESEWQNGYRGLENKKNEFLKRGNSITQQEAEKFQDELSAQQQQIDGRKQTLSQNLNAKSYSLMDDIQKKLKGFLNNYNKDKKYQYILTTGTGQDYMMYKDSSYNITNDVIRGMNEVKWN